MKKITLENSFHGTEITILADEEMAAPGANPLQILTRRAWDGDKNARRRELKIRNTLCPCEGCTCGVIR